MRLKLLLAGLLMLLPLPALADVTASYNAGGKDKFVVEADDGGNFRLGMGDKIGVLHRDGVDYALVANAAGDLCVARLSDVLELILGQIKSKEGAAGGTMPAMTFELRPGAAETVAGYAGMIWLFGPRPEPGREERRDLEVVFSGDPALAPIAAAFRHLVVLANPFITQMFGGEGNFPTVSAELFGKGAPLRLGSILTLESVSKTDIAASRFDLPGPVLEPVEFFKAVTPGEGGGLPALP